MKANQPSAEGWAKLSLAGKVWSVTIDSAPVVVFKVTDASGNPVTGRAVKNAAGAHGSFTFAIAKLIPGDSALGRPSSRPRPMVV